MSREFWNIPKQQKPQAVELDGETHYVRRVTPYELGLVTSQCVAYCGVDVESMGEAPLVKQIRALAFFLTYALCDEDNRPYFDSGDNEEKASDEFIEQVELMRDQSIDRLKIAINFIQANSMHVDDVALSRAKKNLNSMSLESGKSATRSRRAKPAKSGSRNGQQKSTKR